MNELKCYSCGDKILETEDHIEDEEGYIHQECINDNESRLAQADAWRNR